MFCCKFCDFTTESVQTYFNHNTVHRNISSSIYCGYKNCKSTFKQENCFKVHLIRRHGITIKGEKPVFVPVV